MQSVQVSNSVYSIPGKLRESFVPIAVKSWVTIIF